MQKGNAHIYINMCSIFIGMEKNVPNSFFFIIISNNCYLQVVAEHITKLLNGDEDGPKVRAQERQNKRFVE